MWHRLHQKDRTWKNKKCENIKIQQEGIFKYIGELNIKDNS